MKLWLGLLLAFPASALANVIVTTNFDGELLLIEPTQVASVVQAEIAGASNPFFGSVAFDANQSQLYLLETNITATSTQLFLVDLDSGARTAIGAAFSFPVGTLTFDTTRGRLLTLRFAGPPTSSVTLVAIDPMTATLTDLGVLGIPADINGLAYDALNDEVLAIGLSGPGTPPTQLLSLSPLTGAATVISDVTQGIGEGTSALAFDESSRTLYGINVGNDETGAAASQLISIDPITGDAVLEGFFPTETIPSAAFLPLPEPSFGVSLWVAALAAGSRRRV